MHKKASFYLLSLMLAGLSLPAHGQGIAEDIARSHIDANVPPPDKFAGILRRDLESYISQAQGQKVTVKVEMLREGPTQTGLAFPKFYVWARVYAKKRLLDEGAARLAAVERKRFDVTTYLNRSAIRKQPEQLDAVFPKPVVERIRAKVGLPKHEAGHGEGRAASSGVGRSNGR